MNTTYKTMKIEGTLSIPTGKASKEKFDKLYAIVKEFADNEIKCTGNTKEFRALEAYVKSVWDNIKDEFASSALPSINDIKKALQYYYIKSDGISYINFIITKDGIQRLRREFWKNGLVTIADKKETEKEEKKEVTEESEESEGENSNKMDIAIADAIALLKSHGYIVLNKEEYDVVNADDVTDEKSTEVA